MHPFNCSETGPFPAIVTEIFTEYLPQESVQSLTYQPQGLSNDNYCLVTDKHTYLLKFYRHPLPAAQLKTQQTLSQLDLCPQVIAVDTHNNAALFDYFEGEKCTHFEVNKLVNLLSTLHKHRDSGQPLIVCDNFKHYQHLPEYAFFNELISELKSSLSQYPVQIGYCHNDLELSNILRYQNGHHDRWFLIDFEYAHNNDVFFDLAAMSVSFSLTDTQKDEFLRAYLTANNIELDFLQAQKKLVTYQLIYLLLCYFWYVSRQLDSQAKLTWTQITQLQNAQN
ncbi:hypothetical protein PULV_a3411 [Pseudoalteromonas ulvae UL12]|uniref:phosphotransferase n=1 Tax=Pseudoalteromonas ulvae TaxID=107327 RepID=UPI00186B83D8|nr:phosphotransferase [Pseudoalteromonas ulvae]MBE0365098.1 hypothetical protein [Pseudoalteromonas ulvae UL12]